MKKRWKVLRQSRSARQPAEHWTVGICSGGTHRTMNKSETHSIMRLGRWVLAHPFPKGCCPQHDFTILDVKWPEANDGNNCQNNPTVRERGQHFDAVDLLIFSLWFSKQNIYECSVNELSLEAQLTQSNMGRTTETNWY